MGVGPLSDLFCYYLHKYNREQNRPTTTTTQQKYLALMAASYLKFRFNQLQNP